MEGSSQPLGIYVLTLLLYAIPCSLLWASWRRTMKGMSEELSPAWQTRCLKSGFIAAATATVMSLIFLFSYLHNGGGLHGSQTSPGLWTILGRLSMVTAAGSLFLAIVGRSKGTLFLIAWILAIFAVEYSVFQLAFD